MEADKSFPSQLQIMNLGDGSPYETLHSYVSNAVSPYFKSYIRETGKAERSVLDFENKLGPWGTLNSRP